MAEPQDFDHAVIVSEPLRADRYIAEVWGLCSRSQLQQRLVELRVNGRERKPSFLVHNGDHLQVRLRPLETLDLNPEPMDLAIVYEDDEVVVIDKPAGLVVHPAAGNWTGTLVQGLLHHIQDLDQEEFDDESRPGIVHRLDKETSGLLIVAKDPRTHEMLAAQFAARQTDKRYLTVAAGPIRQTSFEVRGCIRRDPRSRQRFAWDATIGKAAHTEFQIWSSRLDHHLIHAQLHTGRTHQIRVHLQHRGLSILGDRLYARPKEAKAAERCLLHAWKLGLMIPSGYREFVAPPPTDFRDAMARLGLAWPPGAL